MLLRDLLSVALTGPYGSYDKVIYFIRGPLNSTLNFVVTFLPDLLKKGMLVLDVTHDVDQTIQNARAFLYFSLLHIHCTGPVED